MNNLNKSKLTEFTFKTRSIDVLRYEALNFAFKSITKKSLGIFMRGQDVISISPQTTGEWEPQINAFFKHIAAEGYSDFLIDIGANIGLTSCQVSELFDMIHMFEPNPLCCNVLEVNSQISISPGKYQIHPFGLGCSNFECTLTIPKNNWGGAHIKDVNNSYDSKILAKKDGFVSIDSSNYFEVSIQVRSAIDELKNTFASLSAKGLRKGVIKIDVEGYEMVILEGIAASIPSDFQAYIVFESLDQNFEIDKLIAFFNGRAIAGKLHRHTPYRKNWPKLIKFLSLALKGSMATSLRLIKNNQCEGDIVIKVNDISK